MSTKVLAASLLASWAAGVLSEQHTESTALAETIAEDSECQADDPSGECSFNALQLNAQRKSVDLESEEGASLVEASREWYSSYYEEDLEYNQTAGGGSCAQYGCVGYMPHHGCQCNPSCGKHNSCCADYQSKCGGRAPPPSATGGMTTSTRDGIPPPSHPFQYNGESWAPMTVQGAAGAEMHFFAIGDWGGMDGALNPPDNFPRMITYPGGNTPGPHIFPRSRLQCPQKPLVSCYSPNKYCNPQCGFVKGVDDQAQLLVAEQFKKRAAAHDPKFILNVGDNFYWGGIAKTCGYPMNKIHPATHHQFETIFEQIYTGPGIDGKPWLSTLGNHDWGGRMFTAGWDQQIAYTWASDRWRMPAAYWHQRINFPDYSVDVYLVDSNFNDAKYPGGDAEHNICGAAHNVPGATCASAGGPSSVSDCRGWFKKLWEEEKAWLDKKLGESDADWKLAVTHFPCDHQPRFWRGMHDRHGLDLLVTGHRHDQELWKANQPGYKGLLGGLTCFVTGGGGGITSEESLLPGKPTHHWPNVDTQYGFFDMTISKEKILVESIDYKGDVVASTVVQPSKRK